MSFPSGPKRPRDQQQHWTLVRSVRTKSEAMSQRGDEELECAQPSEEPESEDYQIVQSSQPMADTAMPSLMPRLGLSALGKQTRRHDRDSELASETDSAIRIEHAGSSRSSLSSLQNAVTQHDPISCVFTGLRPEQQRMFDKNLLRVIEAGLFMEHIPDQVFNGSTTHVITNADVSLLERSGVALCPRALKYLVGMLTGAWIVRHGWFMDSIDAGIWLSLPDPKYLIQGDTQFGPAPGTQSRRIIRSHESLKLFDSCRMYFYGDFGGHTQKSFKKQDLLRLVQCGGATALMKKPTPNTRVSSASRSPSPALMSSTPMHTSEHFSASRSYLYVTENIKPWEVHIDKNRPIIVCDPQTIPVGLTEVKKHNWLLSHQAVSLSWILNCISCSLLGAGDVELLCGSVSNNIAKEQLRELELAWTAWRSKKTT
ncbi:BRCA1-associated RING domain protein 1 [Mortierella sp. GBA30]|nr:BRCA1-associated RING domain protein 1 [Mortierella sp. GBA30]